jgi:putative transposase
LFGKPADYAAFEAILAEAYRRTSIRIAAYCLMPNHWHLLLWPRSDGELSEVMRWITVTHTQRWHAHRHSSGTGPVYQGRFKSFPVETDEHFLTVTRYVERNALRAKLVERAENWQWSSAFHFAHRETNKGSGVLTTKTLDPFTSANFLSPWPMPRPENWLEIINTPDGALELDELRLSVQRGRPFGSPTWVNAIAKQLGLEATLNSRGRPKREK